MVLSINTNRSAMVALENLNNTQNALSQTENAISTGKKVSTSADNPAAFGIAAQLNGDYSAQTAVNDGLSYASSVNNSANAAANSIISVLNNLSASIINAGSKDDSQSPLSKINDEINGYLNQINTIARNSTVQGTNVLSAGTADGLGITSTNLTFVTGLHGETQKTTNLSATIASVTGASKVNSLTDALGLTQVASMGGDVTSNTLITSGSNGFALANDLPDLVKKITQATEAMTVAASKLGANQQTIDGMSTYGQVMANSLSAANGALTDADMSAESARQTSLQTKQSLGIKSLSIANSQAQNILQLFQ